MPRLHPGPGPGAAGGLATEATLLQVATYTQYPYGRAGESYGAGGLTVAYSATPLTLNAADANSEVVPDQCVLSALDLRIYTVVPAATRVTCYLAEDALGLYPVTYPATIPWVLSRTAANYVISYLIDRSYRRSAAGAAGILYLHAFLDAGTCDFIARLRWLP